MQETKIEKNKRKIEGERELTGGTIRLSFKAESCDYCCKEKKERVQLS